MQIVRAAGMNEYFAGQAMHTAHLVMDNDVLKEQSQITFGSLGALTADVEAGETELGDWREDVIESGASVVIWIEGSSRPGL